MILLVSFQHSSLFKHIMQFIQKFRNQLLRFVIIYIMALFLRRNYDIKFVSRPEGVGKTTGNANPLSARP